MRGLRLGRRGLLFAEPILFEDTFGGTKIGSWWTVTDSENKLSVSGGNLVCAGGMAVPAWGDPKLVSIKSLPRRAGLTLDWEIKPTANNTESAFGWHTTNTVSGLTELIGWNPYTDGLLYAQSRDGEVFGGGEWAYTGNTSYHLKIVLKAAGALWYRSTDGGVTWALVWETAIGTTSPLYLGCQARDQAFSTSYIGIFQSIPKPPVINDLFDAWSGWTDVVGTWGVTGGKAYSVTDANADTAVRDLSKADGIFDCTVSGLLDTAVDYSVPFLVLRYLDVNNYLQFWLAAGQIHLRKVDGGVLTMLAEAATVTADSTDYTLRAVMVGNVIQGYKDGTSLFSYTLAGGDTKYSAYTQFGMRLGKSGAPASSARWDNFTFQAGLG